MAAPLRMARAALLFVAIVIAKDPGAHGFATVTSEGGSTAAELKALSAQVSRLEGLVADVSTAILEGGSTAAELKALTAQVSRLEGGPTAAELQALTGQVIQLEEVVANVSTVVLDVSTMVLALSTKPLEAPIFETSLGNGLIPGTDRRQLQADEPSDGGDGNCGILCLPPNLVGGMLDLQLILPLDWECQTGTAGGVYPCPKGRPSTCSLSRYTHELGDGDGLSESCAACFCLLNDHICCEHIDTDKCKRADACGGGDLEDWKESVNDDGTTKFNCSTYTRLPDWCTSYPNTPGLDPHTDIMVTEACGVCRSPNDKCYASTYDLPGWVDAMYCYDDKCDDCADFKKNPSWCTLFSDSADDNGIKVGEACGVCRTRAFGQCSSRFTEPAWSLPWWEDDTAGRSYMNFKITRYEMSPNFGIEFYSTEGDTVRIYPGGEVHFKPTNSERSIVVNEQVLYDMGGGEPARARVLSTGPPKKPRHVPDLSLPLSDTQIQQLRRSAQEPEPYNRRNTRAIRRRARGGFLRTQGAATLKTGGRGGN